MKTELKVGILIAAQSIFAMAFGETWEGTKTFNSDTTITESVTLSGEVTVFVAAGKSVVVSGVIDGSGSLVKTGAGTLELQAQNTFAGDATLSEGFLLVRPKDNVVYSTALGQGTVIIGGQTDSYSGECTLKLYGRNHADKDFTTTTLSIATPIHVTGNTTKDYPAIVFYYQNVELTGKIIADYDFYFYDDFTTAGEIHSGQSDRGGCILSAKFGEIDVAGTLAHDGLCAFHFSGKVAATVIDFESDFRNLTKFGGKAGNRSSQYHFFAENEIGTFLFTSANGQRVVWAEENGSFPGTKMSASVQSSLEGGQIYWSKKEVHVGGFENEYDAPVHPEKTASAGAVNGSATFTLGKTKPTETVAEPWQSSLIIDGVAASEGQGVQTFRATRSFAYLDKITLDADPAFTQELASIPTNIWYAANEKVRMIDVTSGTLRLVDGMGFAGVTNVTCGSYGQLVISSSALEPAFKVAKSLKSGGNMRLGDGRSDFPALQSLTVSANSTLTLEDLPAEALDSISVIHVYGSLTIDPSSFLAFDPNRQLDLYLYDGGLLDLRGLHGRGRRAVFSLMACCNRMASGRAQRRVRKA